MGQGQRRGPKALRFRALLDPLKAAVARIPDTRDPEQIKYSLHDCYLSGFGLFYLQDPSLLEFQRRFEEELKRNNLRSVFGVQAIPGDTQFRDILDLHEYEPIREIYAEWFEPMRRAKLLEDFQVLDGRYLITLDGSQYFSSEHLQCPHCLRKSRKGVERYSHQILQATLVHPQRSQVIPLAPEFICNTDGATKQDCEQNAAKRQIERIRAEHRQLSAIIVTDSLFATGPFLNPLKDKRLSFISVVKPGDHKSLFTDIAGLRRGGMLEHLEVPGRNGRRLIYEWVDQVPLNGKEESPEINFVEFWIIKDGKVSYHNSWATDIEITEQNVEELVRCGRARWKIENEGFNTLKNHGYHLEHNFGHGKKHLSELFFVLNLLAFFVHQIFELVDGWYQIARAGFSARVEFWNAIRAAFRLFLFNNWDEVLARMNGPPQPAVS